MHSACWHNEQFVLEQYTAPLYEGLQDTRGRRPCEISLSLYIEPWVARKHYLLRMAKNKTTLNKKACPRRGRELPRGVYTDHSLHESSSKGG